jgi:adenylate kinase family enzyme
VKRVVVLGPGASGKSTLAALLSCTTGLPLIELDKMFWQPGLVATPPSRWAEVQRELVARSEWIMDGDLGPYDVVEERLRAADTVIVLDVSLVRCIWRAVRRSRERVDFWLWLLRYRATYRPRLIKAIATYASNAEVHVLRNPRAVHEFVAAFGPVPPGQHGEFPRRRGCRG